MYLSINHNTVHSRLNSRHAEDNVWDIKMMQFLHESHYSRTGAAWCYYILRVEMVSTLQVVFHASNLQQKYALQIGLSSWWINTWKFRRKRVRSILSQLESWFVGCQHVWYKITLINIPLIFLPKNIDIRNLSLYPCKCVKF